jgi:cytidine deaminase
MPLSEAEVAALQQRANQAAHNSYSPYSHFRVGASILLHADQKQDGAIVAGANVENASYRLTCCAEQAAIASAVSLYGPQIRIRAVALVNLNSAACMPCGACRQTLLEFSTPENLKVQISSKSGRLSYEEERENRQLEGISNTTQNGTFHLD